MCQVAAGWVRQSEQRTRVCNIEHLYAQDVTVSKVEGLQPEPRSCSLRPGDGSRGAVSGSWDDFDVASTIRSLGGRPQPCAQRQSLIRARNRLLADMVGLCVLFRERGRA